MSHQEKAAAPSAATGQLMDIGTVAAHNIALALDLPDEKVPVVRDAIRDEIQAMSSHFTLACADMSTQYEIDTAKIREEKDDFITAAQAREAQFIKGFKDEVSRIKSTHSYVEANVGRVIAVMAGVFALGVAVGLLV